MATTYEPIATTTLGSDTANITFSSISSSYTDLVLICNWSNGAGGGANMQFNGDTGTNYSITTLNGNGSSAGSTRTTNQNYIHLSYNIGVSTDSTTFAPIIVHINNYSNATTNKTSLSKLSGTYASNGPGVEAIVGLWRSTAAINSIKLFSTGYNLKSGMSATLYGIKAA